MTLLSETVLEERFDFSALEQTVASTIRLAAQNPTSLYLFFQQYIYFNGYASSVISRLASSIAMSRYLFADPDKLVIEEADRGFEIAAEIMVAAADEGAYGVTHRALAQLLLKTVGDYAELSTDERNQFSKAPTWLNEIVEAVMAGYQGTPGNAASLIQAIGFHAASEMLGDREYALLDRIVCHENREVGFARYLKEQTSSVKIREHRYGPWCYVLIHGKHEGTGAEAKHFVHVLDAINMLFLYRPEPEQQILEWVLQGFNAFVELQQRLFTEISRECLELLQTSETTHSLPV